MAMNNAAGSNVAVRHGLRGPFANFSTACSSSAMALGEAMRTIAAGRADAMVAGGSEALLTPGTLAAWQALRTLAPADAADPAASCKPFDKRRSRAGARRRRGRVRAGGGIARARARRAHPRLPHRLRQYLRRGAHVAARPRRPGARHARGAGRSGPRSRADIGYINAHGTATAVGDVVESEAINAVFGERREVRGELDQIHARPPARRRRRARIRRGAARARGGRARRPRRSSSSPTRRARLRHVALAAERIAPPRAVMSNSFAFGGSNVVLIAQRA